MSDAPDFERLGQLDAAAQELGLDPSSLAASRLLAGEKEAESGAKGRLRDFLPPNPIATVSDCYVGQRGEADWYCFTYAFPIGGRTRYLYAYWTVVVARLPLAFKCLEIRPETMEDRIVELLGFHDVNFHYPEFDEHFHIACEEVEFAHEIIGKEAIELLLSQQKRWRYLFHGPYAGITANGRLNGQVMRDAIWSIETLLGQIPESIRKRISIQPTWTSPYD